MSRGSSESSGPPARKNPPAGADRPQLSSGSRTLAEHAAAIIRERIVRGDLPGGHRLVETELAAELGISRIPLREAMHQLMGEGLLDYVPNRGFVVTKMTPSEVAELAELCGLIESHLLEAAVPNLRRGHLEEANHWVVQMDLIADPMEWFQVNWQFHSVLYSAAQRPLQLAQVRTLRARGDRYVALLAADPGLRQGLNLEHREILAACEAGDGPTAVATIERHLQGGRREVSRILEERRGGDSEPLG